MASSGSSSEGQAGGKKKQSEADLSEEMRRMRLHESELDDVYLGIDEIGELAKVARWLAVAKVQIAKKK